MKKLLICGLWSLLRLVADAVRTPYLMASQSPSPGTESSDSDTSDEPRRGMSGALIGLLLIGALAGVTGVGLWVLNQLASRVPTPQETVAPQSPATPASVPVAPGPVLSPAEPEAATEEEVQAVLEEERAALEATETTPEEVEAALEAAEAALTEEAAEAAPRP
jgi:hypothetical protein